MKFEGKKQYSLAATGNSSCPQNQYWEIYESKFLIMILFKFVIFSIKYPQVVLVLDGRYIECEDCPYTCENNVRNVIKSSFYEKGVI